jgi:AcrR family transcriptional regulator
VANKDGDRTTTATGKDVDREQQILQQALRLFSQTGYHGTSLQEIADELGITRPAFYYYFRSKDDLLWRLIGNLGDHLLEEVRPVVSEPLTPEEQLHKLLVAHMHTILGNPEAFKIYFTERNLVDPRRDRQLRRGEEQYIKLYEKVIAQGQSEGRFREGDPHLLALIVTGLANSALRWFQPRRPLTPEAASELLADLAVASIAAPRARRASH